MDILRNAPLGVYLEEPRTWLHRLDPRVKLFWLLSVLLSPILASNVWRLAVVVALLVLTAVARLPRRVWSRQLSFVLVLSLLTFGITSLAPDGLGVSPQPQRQDVQVVGYGLTGIPSSEPEEATRVWMAQTRRWPAPYRYRLVHFSLLGRTFQISRRSLSVALRLGTLMFTLLYATNLFLLTTASEEITEGIGRLLQPLKGWGLPIAEVILTLTLALRFLPLVMEEVQNLVRAVQTRDVRWGALSFRGGIQTLMALVERFFENLLLRAEQTATAMQARGLTGPDHPLRWHALQLRRLDRWMLALLPLFWLVRIVGFSRV
ncbi:energy-coupling factor transporter transmembrane component T family protein [Thermostichus vulcanus]|uniref:Energy-coupling factor transporter transmembrane protein EcfT n=1 Tax=Thermostichus vulcanus str. 'Rupite' TaxID=2813851 RepID=A0ABT0CAR8_THEVL|nr:energy-coupling factor transporter transmembrane protein EcfT [Thermostichus vulcanus str. 'Rupite']